MRRKLLAVPAILVGLGLLTACEEGDTLIFNGIDCGLERLDLTGTWRVQFSPAVSTALFNCDNDRFNGSDVDVDDSLRTYGGLSVFGSDQSTSFVVIGDRTDAGNDAQNDELTASVEADSCLSFLRIWQASNVNVDVYVQCIGTLDRASSTISASCDSVEVVDSDVNVFIDDVCDLNDIATVGVGIL